MIIYICCLICFLLSSLIKDEFLKNILLYLPLFIVCFGYMTGSDWRSYELIYKGNINKVYEPGISLIFQFGRTFNLSFWVLLISIKIICYLKTIEIFKKYFQEYSGLFITLFFAEWGFYLFVDNPLRSFMSFYISLFFIDNLLREEFKKALLFAFIACLFHYSSIFLFLIFFIKNRIISASSYFLIFLILFIFTSFYLDLVLVKIASMMYGEFLESRMLDYLKNPNYIVTENRIGYVHRFFFLSLIAFNIKKFSTDYKTNSIFTFAILYLILYPVTSKIIVLKRFELFLVVPFCIALYYILQGILKWKSQLVIIIVLFSLIKSILLFRTDYRYVPYTNIIVELLKGSQNNYYYRSKYNHKHSPYAR